MLKAFLLNFLDEKRYQKGHLDTFLNTILDPSIFSVKKNNNKFKLYTKWQESMQLENDKSLTSFEEIIRVGDR